LTGGEKQQQKNIATSISLHRLMPCYLAFKLCLKVLNKTLLHPQVSYVYQKHSYSSIVMAN